MATDPKNLVGVTLSGRYRIERRIGEGGMGAVFEATQLSLGRRVAVKVVKPAGGFDDDNLKRFERETEVIAKLAHPNIVHVVDAGRSEDGTMYLAMELIEGENLRQVLKRGPIELARALTIAEDVASALLAAHEAGVIHRDLKSENIMLTRAAGKRETAKVLDFGVAKLTTQTEAPPVTGSGFVAGTPGCIAPEQMTGTTDDPRSDLYAVGVLLFEMLAGEPPFSAGSTMELMLKHLAEPAPRLAAVARKRGRGDVPAAVDDLVAALLSKFPDERPANAAALIERLRTVDDATRDTLSDVRLPSSWSSAAGSALGSAPSGTPIGSRVVAAPPPDTTAAAPQAAVVPAPATSPTTALPAPTAARRAPAWKIAAAAALALVVIGGAAEGWRRYSQWSVDRPSQVPAAEADLERAIRDYWDVDLDKLDEDTAAAVALDPRAPLAHVLRAGAKSVLRAPSVRIDADLLLAENAARRRATMLVQRTRTESLVDVLGRFAWQDVEHAYEAHCKTFHGCTDLEKVLVANKLALSTAPADVVAGVIDGVDSEQPMVLLVRGRVARWRRQLDVSRALLEKALMSAPGRPAVVEALVDTLLEAGDRAGAEAQLAKLSVRDLRAAVRLAGLHAGDGDVHAFDAVAARIRGLPDHTDERIDGITLLGFRMAALGRFHDADLLLREAVADRPPTPLGDARALESAAVAVLFGLVDDDGAFAQGWMKAINDVGIESGPGVERLAAFQRAARALLAVYDDSVDVSVAEDELARLEQVPNDVPIVLQSVRFHLAMREHKLDEARRIAGEMDVCFRNGNLAALARAQHDVAAETRALDAALDEGLERHCVTGDDLIPFILNVVYAQLAARRAVLAVDAGDDAGARAWVQRFHRLWPEPDPSTGAGAQPAAAAVASVERRLAGP